MTTFNELTDIDRRILFTLDDAGEEYVSALINTVIECKGCPSEVTRVVGSLRNFLRESLVSCAIAQDTEALTLINLTASEAIHGFNVLPEQIAWSREHHLWLWTSGEPRLVVLLTNAGKSISKKIVTGIGAEKIRTFLSARSKDPRWYREYKGLSEKS